MAGEGRQPGSTVIPATTLAQLELVDVEKPPALAVLRRDRAHAALFPRGPSRSDCVECFSCIAAVPERPQAEREATSL